MEASDSVITEEEREALDAQYEPFPSFDQWPDGKDLSARWKDACGELTALAKSADEIQLSRARDLVMRAAAIDTGAIEGLYSVDQGFTLTVAHQAAAWQQAVSERGENVRALFEAQLSTYQLVLDAATKRLPVTEAWVRRLHEEICAPQETYRVVTPGGEQQEHPLAKGQYKTQPNHVRLPDGSVHSYAPVVEVHAEMHRLVEELSSNAFSRAHPVIQAAFAHYAFVVIHPFADGNGRVARALASTYLYRAANVPLLVFADQRTEYFSALHWADKADFQPFARYVFDCAIGAVKLVSDTLKTAAAPAPEQTLQRIHELLTAQGKLTHLELDNLGATTFSHMHRVFTERINELPKPPGVEAAAGNKSGGSIPEQEGFRPFAVQSIPVTVRAASPAQGEQTVSFYVYVSKSKDEAETVLIRCFELDESLVFALSEVNPAPTTAARQRLRSLADRTLGRLFEQLEATATESLRQSGYL